MKYVLIYTLFLMFVFCSSCGGQNQPYPPPDIIRSETKDTVTSYGPNTMVRNVKQDRNGNILFAASWGGVFRYDGKLFTKISSKIGSRRFWDVLEDQRGNLWFATTDSGVYHYDGKFFKHFTTREGLANNLVTSICEGKAGVIWFGTGGGVSRYDGKSFRNFTTKDGLLNNGINSIMEDKTGKLWIGASEPCFYDGKTFTVLKNKDGKAFNNVRSIIEDKKGNIWFGGSDGLWRYDGNTFTNITRKFIGHIYEDNKGNIWTTGEVKPNKPNIGNDWVLCRYDQKSLYNEKPTVTEIKSKHEGGKGMLCGMLEANDGSIWFGSLYGVYRYDGKTITDFRRKEDQK
ncbi:ligand-binding sensor domain-containing protein [Terrimonas pollutisoli]|uniref:ligand-binding sensor domain-containing protein n=1 Tax=Terrimonas pollutisoli TaxID=3034147 RepID=UPI0023EDB54F|nr:two-component regulator propeller domain-containing protein [Terrimonas sp. H1YJ31]